MTWNEAYPKSIQPTTEQIDVYIGNPLWSQLCVWLEQSYADEPRIEHSVCSGAPGWNVKYKKGGRSLCTLYPHDGYYTCLVCIGNAESTEAELIMPMCTRFVQELYQRTKPFNGSRWLMVNVTDSELLADVQRLIGLRARPARNVERGSRKNGEGV
ncbi:MAG: DUF3788 domain-containing protein [Eubacteriales bacterium]|nr:DUF3788 domain-containing protein [Eubacteriales bacterium]